MHTALVILLIKKKMQNINTNLTKSVNVIENEDKKKKRIFYSKIFNNCTIDLNNEKRNFVTKLQKKNLHLNQRYV